MMRITMRCYVVDVTDVAVRSRAKDIARFADARLGARCTCARQLI